MSHNMTVVPASDLFYSDEILKALINAQKYLFQLILKFKFKTHFVFKPLGIH